MARDKHWWLHVLWFWPLWLLWIIREHFAPSFQYRYIAVISREERLGFTLYLVAPVALTLFTSICMTSTLVTAWPPCTMAKELNQCVPSLTCILSQSKAVCRNKDKNRRPKIAVLAFVSKASSKWSAGWPSPTSIDTRAVPHTASESYLAYRLDLISPCKISPSFRPYLCLRLKDPPLCQLIH